MQFESALQALQQLEGQYTSLSAESAAAERARTGRIQQLEMEVDALQAANAALQADQDSMARRGAHGIVAACSIVQKPMSWEACMVQ